MRTMANMLDEIKIRATQTVEPVSERDNAILLAPDHIAAKQFELWIGKIEPASVVREHVFCEFL